MGRSTHGQQGFADDLRDSTASSPMGPMSALQIAVASSRALSSSWCSNSGTKLLLSLNLRDCSHVRRGLSGGQPSLGLRVCIGASSPTVKVQAARDLLRLVSPPKIPPTTPHTKRHRLKQPVVPVTVAPATRANDDILVSPVRRYQCQFLAPSMQLGEKAGPLP
ncbi:hypothetical protein LIA77_06320 [Sarocladium implicatum]|nr:hypothetical protein LIA77_06320 [Sarocladium implicatum]